MYHHLSPFLPHLPRRTTGLRWIRREVNLSYPLETLWSKLDVDVQVMVMHKHLSRLVTMIGMRRTEICKKCPTS